MLVRSRKKSAFHYQLSSVVVVGTFSHSTVFSSVLSNSLWNVFDKSIRNETKTEASIQFFCEPLKDGEGPQVKHFPTLRSPPRGDMFCRIIYSIDTNNYGKRLAGSNRRKKFYCLSCLPTTGLQVSGPDARVCSQH